jgi:hypothetical protein
VAAIVGLQAIEMRRLQEMAEEEKKSARQPAHSKTNPAIG